MENLCKLFTINLCNFIFVIIFILPITNLECNSAKVPKKVVESSIKPKENDKIPICYSKSDFDLNDTSKLFIILRKISLIKEVRNYSNQNKNQILYCVTETDDNDIYQSNSYHIRVMLNNIDHYSCRFNFYIKKKSNEIKVLEVVSDSLLLLEEWRKREK